MNNVFATPDDIAKAGREIYDSDYREKLETESIGSFVAISVYSRKYYLAIDADVALQDATKAEPDGLFHLIRVGSQSVFKLGFLSSGQGLNWFV